MRTSAAIGTVELTGLEMMLMTAFGQYRAQPSARVFTIPARSSKGLAGSLCRAFRCLTRQSLRVRDQDVQQPHSLHPRHDRLVASHRPRQQDEAPRRLALESQLHFTFWESLGQA